MKSRIHPAPFALAADGTLLVNAIHFGDGHSIQALVRTALSEAGAVFIGVPLRAKDAAHVLESLDDATAEAIAQILGRRHR